MYYIDFLYVYDEGIQLRTFYGPFDTKEERDIQLEVMVQARQDNIRDILVSESAGTISSEDAQKIIGRINNSFTYSPHDGPLPPGDWYSKSFGDVLIWHRNSEMKIIIREMRRSINRRPE